MAGRIQGITVEIGGDTTKLQTALKGVNTEIRNTRSRLRDADNIYQSSDNMPVAYASNDVNATTNTKRGSMNLTESKTLENGYRFVWEFTPSQGNGTIAAVGLTSRHGGANFSETIAKARNLKYNKLYEKDNLSISEQVR